MALPSYVDATSALVDWINHRTRLVGRGKPLSAGAHDEPQKSPGAGALVFVTWTATSPEQSEAPISSPLLTCAVYGATERCARRGAVALANELVQLDGDPITVGDAVVLCVEQITGPSRLPDGVEHRYLVDVVLNLEQA